MTPPGVCLVEELIVGVVLWRGCNGFDGVREVNTNYRGKRSLCADYSAKPSIEVTANDANFKVAANA